MAENGLRISHPYSDQSQLKLLVFGQAGAGKTVLAATAEDDPRSAPTLFVDFEGGTLSIRHRRNLDVLRIEDYSRDMSLLHKQLQAWQTDGNFPYRTLVMDSLTEWSELAMQSVLRMPAKREVEGNPEWPDWNTWTNRMASNLKFFTKLPLNVIMTGLEDTDNGVTGVMLKGKQLPVRINAFFDIVGRLYVQSSRDAAGKTVRERRLLLEGDSRYRLRDRTSGLGLLEPEVAEPTITKLLDRIVEGERMTEEHAV